MADADELLASLEGSAAEVVQATGLKVETMQKAITWLIAQQKQHVSALEGARGERDELRGRCAGLASLTADATARGQLGDSRAVVRFGPTGAAISFAPVVVPRSPPPRLEKPNQSKSSLARGAGRRWGLRVARGGRPRAYCVRSGVAAALSSPSVSSNSQRPRSVSAQSAAMRA